MNSYTVATSLTELSRAVEMEHRMTDVEAILPTLVTKAEFNKAIGEIRVDNEKFRTDVNKSIADMRIDFEKGQKENRVWMLGTVIALVVGFGTVLVSFHSSTAQSIDRMDRRIERMDERIEQFREFMQSQRPQPATATSEPAAVTAAPQQGN